MIRLRQTGLLLLLWLSFQNPAWSQNALVGTYRSGGEGAGGIYRVDTNGENYESVFEFPVVEVGGEISYPLGRQPIRGMVEVSEGIYYGATRLGGRQGHGTIYSYNITTNRVTIIHEFDDTNGSSPTGALLKTAGGLLYGTTGAGGTNNDGTIYRLNPTTNTFTKIFDFNINTSGEDPRPLVQAANGKLYGTTKEGGNLGNSGRGSLFEFDPSTNMLRTLRTFTSFNTEQFGRIPGELSIHPNGGVLYFMTTVAQQGGRGSFIRYNISTEVFNKFLDISPPVHGHSPSGNLTFSGGEIYGMMGTGGPGNRGVIFRHRISNNEYRYLYEDFSQNGFAPTGGFTLFNDKLYGATARGGDNSIGVFFVYDITRRAYKVTHSFTSATGHNPFGQLVPYCQVPVIKNETETYQVTSGQTLSIDLEGSFIDTYVWKKNGQVLSNQVGDVLSIPNTTFSDAGTYSVEVTNDCSGVTTSFSFEVNVVGLSADFSKVDVSCFGGSDGSITVSNLTGGVSPYTYSLDGENFQNSNTFTGLAAGMYEVTVKDAGELTSTAEINITAPAQLSADLSIEPISCNGGNDAAFMITATGGTEPYSYSLDGENFQATNIFTELAAGTYQVVVKDDNDCKTFISTILSEPDAIQLSFEVKPAACEDAFDGAIIITATGGVTPYEYVLVGDGYQDSNEFLDFAPGEYEVGVLDANGCEVSEVVSITTNFSATVTKEDASCATEVNDGSITVSDLVGGTNPYLYSLDGINFQSGNTFSGLAAGEYEVTVEEGNGCLFKTMVTILKGAGFSATVTKEDVSCIAAANDGSITISNLIGGNAPYEYSLDGENFQSNNTFAGLQAGEYEVTTRDAGRCVFKTMVTILEGTDFSAAVNKADISCFSGNDGSITVSNPIGGNAPYEYSLDGGNFQSSSTFTGLETGAYEVTTRDAGGCEYKEAVTLTAPDVISLSATITDSSDPKGNGSLSLTIAGGTAPYEIVWDNEATGASLTELSAGDYEATVTDAKGCEQVEKFTVGGVTSLEDLKQEGILIYPNPVEESFIIHLQQVSKAQQVHIYTLKGRRVHSNNLKLGENRIEVTQWQSGLYLLRFENGGSTQLLVK